MDQHPRRTDLVKGVSLAINPGEVVAWWANPDPGNPSPPWPSRACPPRTLPSDADLCAWATMNMLAAPPGRLAKDISIVYQDPGTTFNPSLRMGSQLTEVLRTHLGMGRARPARSLSTPSPASTSPSPAERLRQHPHELSGGMRRRGHDRRIDRHPPKLIVADEPTTALDVTVQAEVLRQFRRIHREQGTAMLFISHDLGVVEALCDTILVMKSGEIVERLTSAELAARDVHHPYTKALLAAIHPGYPARYRPPQEL